MKNCKWLTVAILAIVQTLSACARDVTEVQEFSLKGLPGTADARLNSPGIRRLDVIPSNLNLCEAGDAVRDPAGKFLYWNSNRQQVDPSYTAADSVTSFYRAMRFDGNGKQTQDLQCVLKAGAAAEATLRALTANVSPLRAGWARVEEGTWCYIYTNVVECGSVSCVSGTVLRAGARAITAADSFEIMKTGPRSVEGKGWFCEDGDYLIEHSNWFEIIKPGQPGYNGCVAGTHWSAGAGGCVEDERTCGMDSTWVPQLRASFCQSDFYLDTVETSIPDEVGEAAAVPNDTLNADGYLFKKHFVYTDVYVVDFTDEDGKLHKFDVTDGNWSFTGRFIYDRTSQGWDATFGLNNPLTNSQGHKQGEYLIRLLKAPSKVKFRAPLSGSGFYGSMAQIGIIEGRFIVFKQR